MEEKIKQAIEFLSDISAAVTMAKIIDYNVTKVAAKANVPETVIVAIKEHTAEKSGFAGLSPIAVLKHPKLEQILAAIAARIPNTIPVQSINPISPNKANVKITEQEKLTRLSIRRWLAANPESELRANEFTFSAAFEAVKNAKATEAEAIYAIVSEELCSKDTYRNAKSTIIKVLNNRGWTTSNRPKEGQIPIQTDKTKGIIGTQEFIGVLHSVQYDGASAEEACDFFGFVPRNAIKSKVVKEVSLDDFDLTDDIYTSEKTFEENII